MIIIKMSNYPGTGTEIAKVVPGTRYRGIQFQGSATGTITNVLDLYDVIVRILVRIAIS